MPCVATGAADAETGTAVSGSGLGWAGEGSPAAEGSGGLATEGGRVLPGGGARGDAVRCNHALRDRGERAPHRVHQPGLASDVLARAERLVCEDQVERAMHRLLFLRFGVGA